MITEKQDRGLMEPNPDVLRANAYHEAGRATHSGYMSRKSRSAMIVPEKTPNSPDMPSTFRWSIK